MGKRPKTEHQNITLGFEQHTIYLQLDQIMRLKTIPEAIRTSRKFRQILSSIREIGIIEPPVVIPDKSSPDKYILLDGHLRLEALKELNRTGMTCLVSRDDESFSYNKHINRLSTVQEHKMILKAIERGVPEERIAAALDVDISHIRQRRDLLKGICEEAADLLKDRIVPMGVFKILRLLKPLRQIDAAMLMNDHCNYSVPHMQAILAASSQDELAQPEKPKKVKGLSVEQMDRMEEEMGSLQREYRLIQDNYTSDVFHLQILKTYLTSLLNNAHIHRYLEQNHAEFIPEFEKITKMSTIGKSLSAQEY